MFITILAATPRSGSAVPPAGTAGGGATGRDATGRDATAADADATTTAVETVADGAAANAETAGGAAAGAEAGSAGFVVWAAATEPIGPFDPLPGAVEGIVTIGETARTDPLRDPLPVAK